MVVFGCFSTDLICQEEQISKGKSQNMHYNCSWIDQTHGNTTCTHMQPQQTVSTNCSDILSISIMVPICIILLVILTFTCIKQRLKDFYMNISRDKERGLEIEATSLIKDSGGDIKGGQQSADLENGSTSKNNKCQNDIKTFTSVDNDKVIFVDFAVEDSEIFFLLKRQCKNGVLRGFSYLNETRIKKKKKHKIFCQRDEVGCTLLHYAAQGGSIAILKEIIKTNSEVEIDIKCFHGQTVLGYAIKYQQKDMCEFLIIEYKDLLLDNSISTCTCQGIKPIHWAAWHGDLSILCFLRQNNVHLNAKTKNGLNILDIAVMRNKYEFCESMINNENMIQDIKLDECGWNIAHYAAYANNVNVLKLLKSKNESFILAKTKTMKTTLHIACEYGHLEVVKFITENFEDLLQCTDDLEWNALHYAGKGGNLQVLLLLQKKGLIITSPTKEEKTVLHIACTHKQVNICRYVAEAFYKDPQKRDLINKKTTNQWWMAAHYIGVERKGDGSEEEIVDILFGYEADLSGKTKQGWSVLRIAMDHCNTRLVKHLLSKTYRNKLKISEEILFDYIKNTKDESIQRILHDTLGEMKTE
ncbi:putative ankyrin repeat protein RF_0381 [Saccostrea cucullata]|uniref:putative ankyrin repeat protein RF_0381 n=1 Tax=Saccostrea cuccullata TaxID=36930 RepID=UPI002ED56AF0